MHSIYSINELTILRFVFAALIGKKVYVLSIDPIFIRLKRHFAKVVSALVRTGRARYVTEPCPELRPVMEYPYRALLKNVFGEVEGWQKDNYSFDEVDRRCRDYARAFKQVTCNYLAQHLATIVSIKPILDAFPVGQVRVLGLSRDVVAAAEVYWGINLDDFVPPLRVPKRLINLIITLPVLAYASGWVISRIRPFGVSPKPYFFAADYIADESDINLYRELEEGGPILLVARNSAALARRPREDLQRYTVCRATDGAFGLVQGIAALGRLLRDGVRVLAIFGRHELAVYYLLVTLPLRRVQYRALFECYRPWVYWGRDSYDPKHILRQQELHRVGGQSWSVCHSYLTYCESYPEFRYLSYDRYYVMGRAFYERFYKDTWYGGIDVVESGSFRASRQVFARRLEDKPKDILVLASVFIFEPGMVEIVRALATAFPDRSIWLQVKSLFLDLEAGRRFVARCTEGLANVAVTEESPYELFAKARYAVSDPSSVVIEAVQFGLYSFVADVSKEQKASILREIEGFCVAGGDEAVQRIRGIESGDWRYPIEAIGNFVDLSGRTFCDSVRGDLGLEPRSPAQSAWETANDGHVVRGLGRFA